MSEQIIASSIEAAGILLGSLITMGGVLLAAHRVTSRRKLKQDLLVAYKDILALYAIEEEQILTHKTNNKIAVRKTVATKSGLQLSNKLTPSRIKPKILELELMGD